MASEIDLNKKMVALRIEVSAEEIIDQLFWAMNEDEMVVFVKKLDEYQESYGFSEPLYRYFKKQHKNYKKENPEGKWGV